MTLNDDTTDILAQMIDEETRNIGKEALDFCHGQVYTERAIEERMNEMADEMVVDMVK